MKFIFTISECTDQIVLFFTYYTYILIITKITIKVIKLYFVFVCVGYEIS